MPTALEAAVPVTPGPGDTAVKGAKILNILKLAAGQAQQIRGEILALRMQQHVADQEQNTRGAANGHDFAEPPSTAAKGFSEGGFQAPRLDPGKWEESGEQQASPKAPADENLANQLATLLKNLKEKKTVAGAQNMTQADLIASMLASAKKPPKPNAQDDSGLAKDVDVSHHTPSHEAANAAPADSGLTSVVDGLMYGMTPEQQDTADSAQAPSIGIILGAADGSGVPVPTGSVGSDCTPTASSGLMCMDSQASSAMAGQPQPAVSAGLDAVLMGSPLTGGVHGEARSQLSSDSVCTRPALNHATLAKILRKAPSRGGQKQAARKSAAPAPAPAQPPPPPPVTKMDVLARLRKANEAFNKKHAGGHAGTKPRSAAGSEDGTGAAGKVAGKGDLYQRLLARSKQAPTAARAGAGVAGLHGGRTLGAKISGAPQRLNPQQQAVAHSPDRFAAITRQQQAVPQQAAARAGPMPSPGPDAGVGAGGARRTTATGDGRDAAALAAADAQGVIAHGYVIVSRRGTRHSDVTAAEVTLAPLSQPHNSLAGDHGGDGSWGSRRPSAGGDGAREADGEGAGAGRGDGFVVERMDEREDESGHVHVSLGDVPARLRELTPGRARYAGAPAAAPPAPGITATPDRKGERVTRRLHFAADNRKTPGSGPKAGGIGKPRGGGTPGGRGRAVSAGRAGHATRFGGVITKDGGKATRGRATTPGRLIGTQAAAGNRGAGRVGAGADRARILKPTTAANAAAARRAKSAPHTRTPKSARKGAGAGPVAAPASPGLSPWIAHELVGDGRQGLKWRATSLALSSTANSPANPARVAQVAGVRPLAAIETSRAAAGARASQEEGLQQHQVTSTAHQPTQAAWRGAESVSSEAAVLLATSVAASSTHPSPLRAAMARVQLMGPPSPSSTCCTPASKRSHTYNGPSPGSSFSPSPTHSVGSEAPPSVSPATRMRGYANAAALLVAGRSLMAQAAADAGVAGHTTSTHHAQPATAPTATPAKAPAQAAPIGSSSPSMAPGPTAVAHADDPAAATATAVASAATARARLGTASPRACRSLGASAGAVGAGSPRAGNSTGAISAGHTRNTEDLALSAMSAITKKAPDAGPMHGNLVGLSPDEVLRRTLRRDGPPPRASPVKPHAATLNLPPHLAGFRGPGGAASYAAAAAVAAAAVGCGSPAVPRYAQSTAASAAKASPQAQLSIILSKPSPPSRRHKSSASRLGGLSSAGSSPGTTPLRPAPSSRRDAAPSSPGMGGSVGSQAQGTPLHSAGALGVQLLGSAGGIAALDREQGLGQGEGELTTVAAQAEAELAGDEGLGVGGVQLGVEGDGVQGGGGREGEGGVAGMPPGSIAKLVHEILQKHSSEAAALDLSADMLLGVSGVCGVTAAPASIGTCSSAANTPTRHTSKLPSSIGDHGSGALTTAGLAAATPQTEPSFHVHDMPLAKALAAASSPLAGAYPFSSQVGVPRVTGSANNTPRTAHLPPSPSDKVGAGAASAAAAVIAATAAAAIEPHASTSGAAARSPSVTTRPMVARSPSSLHARKDSLGAASDLNSYRQLAARAANHRRSPSLGAAPFTSSPLITPDPLPALGGPLGSVAVTDELSGSGGAGGLPGIPSSHDEPASFGQPALHSFQSHQLESVAVVGQAVASTPHGAVLLECLPRTFTVREAISRLGAGLTAGVSMDGESGVGSAPAATAPRGLGSALSSCFGLCLGGGGSALGGGSSGAHKSVKMRVTFEVGPRAVVLVRRGPSGFTQRNVVHGMGAPKVPWAPGAAVLLRCGPTEGGAVSQPPSLMPSPRGSEPPQQQQQPVALSRMSGMAVATLAAAGGSHSQGRTSGNLNGPGTRPSSSSVHGAGAGAATTVVRVVLGSATEHALVVLGLNAALLNTVLPPAARVDEGSALRTMHWLRSD